MSLEWCLVCRKYSKDDIYSFYDFLLHTFLNREAKIVSFLWGHSWRSASFCFFFLTFLVKKKACGISVALPEMEHTAPAVEVQSVNPCTAKEVPGEVYLEGGS